MKKIICAFQKPDCPNSNHEDLLFAPAIRIEKLDYKLPTALDNYSWLLFTSKNGIRHFDALHQSSYQGKIAVLGKSTACELKKYGYTADFIGDGSSSSAMAKSMVSVVSPEDKILAVLGQMASFNLQIGMGEKLKVDRIDVYNTQMESLQNKEVRQLILADNYKMVLVGSPSAVKSLKLNFGSGNIEWRVGCIGKTTAAACKSAGINPLFVSSQPNFETLLQEALTYQLDENI